MVTDGDAASAVVLLGMMGAGKTSVGRALAARTTWPYLDNDELVRAATGRAPEEIDATDGTEALHVAEAAALRRALSLPPPLVASAAASAVADQASRDLLRTARTVVYLRAQPVTLRERIGAGAGRRADATDLGWLRERFSERDAAYRAVATLTIDTDGIPADEVARRILAQLELH